MSTTVSELAEKILSKSIDKQEALSCFQSLSNAEQEHLEHILKLRLSDDDSINKHTLLKAVDQRDLNDHHKNFIKKLTQNYEKFVPKSKENALKHQNYFVDQRKNTNLKKSLKALQFHITYEKAQGAYLYDIDGNKYVDVTGDNGVNIFGHQPDFIKESIKNRIDKGFPLVGYTEDLFKTAKLFCEITDNERMLFTQSGTEAVMWAVRIARAATQKKKIVIFEGSYHGLSDAVIAVKDHTGKSLAMGLGMLQEFADQLIVLDYGSMKQLDIIEKKADIIAGILVEPVQSRHADNQPLEFLKQLRKLTLKKGIPLIFDEMVTGFRVCPKGAQGYFGIKADISTYGKIPGGGMPTGIIAGSAKYMNFVDGGILSFDDDSMPSSKRTLMAGTHTRNPIKIAACFATLSEIKKRCPGNLSCDSCSCFQKTINEKTKFMAKKLNTFFLDKRLPVIIDYFGSLFKFRFIDSPYSLTRELFIILLRMNNIETSISGNFFLTTAHTDEDIKNIISGVKKSLQILIKEGFFYEGKLSENERQVNRPYNSTNATNIKNKLEPVIDANDIDTEKLKNLIKSDLKYFM